MYEGFILEFAIAVLIFIFAVSFAVKMDGTKTGNYRRKLVDLYVAGTIRKLATKDDVNLDNEYKAFVKDAKKYNLKDKGLSSVVEDELSEKVIDAQDKVLKPKK